MSITTRLFYRIRPMMPRKMQISLRRIRARRLFRLDSPPFIRSSVDEPHFHWSNGARSAAVLTHDVETLQGQELIEPLRQIEEEFSLLSNWNFVSSRYEIDEGIISVLRKAGHEIGVHGVYHDGRMFSSVKEFRRRLALATEAASEWGANGFRSPSLIHDREMLTELPFLWDSSIPAWDPFQPQPGGCGRYYPFKLSDTCVELPVTLWQDFTLFEELQQTDISIWKEQINAIYEMGGLINVIVHPDYMNEQRLNLYRELLEYLQSKKNLWFALPSEIAEICCNQKSLTHTLR